MMIFSMFQVICDEHGVDPVGIYQVSRAQLLNSSRHAADCDELLEAWCGHFGKPYPNLFHF